MSTPALHTLPATDLDTVYTALANAIHDVGTENEGLFLSMLALSLLSQQPSASAALQEIEQATALTRV